MRFSSANVLFVVLLSTSYLGATSELKSVKFKPQQSLNFGTWTAEVSKATVNWPVVNRSSHAFRVPVLSRHEAVQLRQMIESFNDFSFEADTTDGAPAYEAYLVQQAYGQDVLPHLDKQTDAQRKQLLDLTAPIVSDRILPFVNQNYGVCEGTCHVCSSLIRRYVEGERRVVEDHHDLDALVTVVISLNDAGPEGDFEGGLHVVLGGHRLHVPLEIGDAVVHRSDLFHGVDVTKGTRWSWINWIERKACKTEDSVSWYLEAAKSGDPVSQYIMSVHHANTMQREGASWGETKTRLDDAQVRGMLVKSAKQGFAPALARLGAAHLDGADGFKQNVTKGLGLLKRASSSERGAMLALGQYYGGTGEYEKALGYFSNPMLKNDRTAKFYLGLISQSQGKLKKAAKYYEASGRAEAFANRAEVAKQLGADPNSASVLSWVAKAARMGHRESCDSYRGSPHPDQKVVIDCVSVQGHEGLYTLMDDVFPTLQQNEDRLYAMRNMRSLASTMKDPSVPGRLAAFAKKHRLEL